VVKVVKVVKVVMGNYLSCTGLSISVLIAVDIFLRQENSKSSKYILSRSLDETIYPIHYASEVTANDRRDMSIGALY
jgi:hypothetical protein